MAKYTDEQIKKGLWRCSYQEKVCPHCHFQENGKNCKEILMKNALDLINRQEAEIDYWKSNAFDGCMERGRMAETARSEAIKEFAERLKKRVRVSNLGDLFVYSWDINNLEKEMVGESNVD